MVPGMMLPCAKGHGGPGQNTGLPIGCVWGGTRTGPGNAVGWRKGTWRDGSGDIAPSCHVTSKLQKKGANRR